MRIGLDFDNTIVSYDHLFHKVAVEAGYVPPVTPQTKLAVRDHLRATQREAIWTELQGYVYGARMMEAAAYTGVLDFLRAARRSDLAVSIVSHKTRHPFIGHPYDLHEAARQWIARYLFDNEGPLIPGDSIHFELTKEDKLKRIAACNFAFFVDDLPEILAAPSFPAATVPILFDPAGVETAPPRAVRMANWASIQSYIESLCPAS